MYLEFDFTELFFLPTELLFLETHTLGGELLGEDGKFLGEDAELLGEDDAAELLAETLKEEKTADKKLTSLAKGINVESKV